MSALALDFGLAVLASVALNAAYLLQHAGSRDAPELSVRHPLASLRAPLGSRRPWRPLSSPPCRGVHGGPTCSARPAGCRTARPMRRP